MVNIDDVFQAVVECWVKEKEVATQEAGREDRCVGAGKRAPKAEA